MQTIPAKLRKEIDKSQWLKKCWLCGSAKVEINHTFIYSGRQINELWALSALCKEHHTGKTGFHSKKDVHEKIEKMCLDRTDVLGIQIKYPKRNWIQLYKYLCQKFVN